MDFDKYLTRKQIGLIIVIILIFVGVKMKKQDDKKYLKMNIYGVVTKVKYDIKGNVSFTICDKRYYSFSFLYDKDDHISVGDTIIKKSGSYKLNVFKKHK
jgi:hypothetical protein